MKHKDDLTKELEEYMNANSVTSGEDDSKDGTGKDRLINVICIITLIFAITAISISVYTSCKINLFAKHKQYTAATNNAYVSESDCENDVENTDINDNWVPANETVKYRDLEPGKEYSIVTNVYAIKKQPSGYEKVDLLNQRKTNFTAKSSNIEHIHLSE